MLISIRSTHLIPKTIFLDFDVLNDILHNMNPSISHFTSLKDVLFAHKNQIIFSLVPFVKFYFLKNKLRDKDSEISRKLFEIESLHKAGVSHYSIIFIINSC